MVIPKLLSVLNGAYAGGQIPTSWRQHFLGSSLGEITSIFMGAGQEEIGCCPSATWDLIGLGGEASFGEDALPGQNGGAMHALCRNNVEKDGTAWPQGGVMDGRED